MYEQNYANTSCIIYDVSFKLNVLTESNYACVENIMYSIVVNCILAIVLIDTKFSRSCCVLYYCC